MCDTCKCVVIGEARFDSRISLLLSHTIESSATLKYSVTTNHILNMIADKFGFHYGRRVLGPPPTKSVVVVDEHGVLTHFRVCLISGTPVVYRVSELRSDGAVADGCFLYRLAAALKGLLVHDGYFGFVHSDNSVLAHYLKPVAVKYVPWLKCDVAYYCVSDLPTPNIVGTVSFQELYELARQAKEARRRSRVKIYPSGVSNT